MVIQAQKKKKKITLDSKALHFCNPPNFEVADFLPLLLYLSFK